MRKVTEQLRAAFEARAQLRVGNTECTGDVVMLNGNPIVRRDSDGVVWWTLAGWNTVTTRELVNDIADAGVHQVKGVPVIDSRAPSGEEFYSPVSSTEWIQGG